MSFSVIEASEKNGKSLQIVGSADTEDSSNYGSFVAREEFGLAERG